MNHLSKHNYKRPQMSLVVLCSPSKQTCRGLFLLVFFVASFFAQAQPIYPAKQQATIRSFAQQVQTQAKIDQEKTLLLAKKNNWPLRQTFSDGSVMILSGVSETGQPLYDITTSNRLAGSTTQTNALFEGGGLGLKLTGGTPALRERLAVWDGGRVLATHTELNGRVRQIDSPSATDAHATHVTGTMIATGNNPRAQGMATQANLLAYDFSNAFSEMSAAAANLLVSNHSYGPLAGWRFNSDRPGNDNLKWEWYGDTTVSATEEYRFGFYDTDARDWDRLAYTSPKYLIVKSAGNAHGSNGPTGGAPYFFGSSTRTSTTPRANQSGYDQITTYTSAKNILTVGAISALSNGYNLISDPRISSFSSWGPTDDGRIKPDITGVGVSVFSTVATGNNAYGTLSGTSMSTPNVSGSVFLLAELFQNLNGDFARSSTLKGLVLHTANDAGNPGPDYQYGWGLLNARRAAEVLLNRDQNHSLAQQTLMPNQTFTTQVVASGRGPLVVSICWTDPEATPTTASSANVNNRTPKLVNDLDLRVSDGSNENLPWVLNPDQPALNATRGDNIRDNVEQILITNPIPGRTYTVTVRHKGTLTNGQQEYVLIMSGIGGKAYCESRATDAADSKITRVVVGSIAQNANAGCQSYTDFTNLSTNISSGQSLPFEVGVGSCGADFTKIVKIFADWNNDGDLDDANELVATSDPIGGTGTFRGNVTAPSGLINGNTTRLRVVCVETSNAASVLACGTFGKGETQEFLLNFVRPSRDLSVRSLVAPSSGTCGNQIGNVTLVVRNLGTSAVQNVPVSVTITTATGQQVGVLSTTIAQSVAAFADATVSLSGAALNNLQPNTAYNFVCRANLTNDQDTTNNSLRQTITTATIPARPVATATYCGTDPLSLVSSGTGTAFWYDAPTGGNLLAAGNTTSSNLRQPNGVFYVALNEFSGSIGPVGKSTFGGGSYSGNFGPAPLIRAEVPLLLESARLYISSAGRLTFNVLTLDDAFVSSTTIDVTPTRNANAPNVGAPAGQVADDPNDLGAVYPLNLSLPRAGNYKIQIEYENGATIFRSNIGVTGFPYTIPNVMTLRGALFNRTETQVDTLTNAYYYFYDLKVRSLGCAGERVPINAQTASKTTPTITFDGAPTFCEMGNLRLTASAGSNSYQWFLNGQAINGATSGIFTATLAGSYTVSSATNNCLPTLSAPVVTTVRSAERPVITLANAVELRSNASLSNQWFLNGLPISGATNQTFVASRTGSYAVRANVNGCGELLSNEIAVIITALDNAPPITEITLNAYPNPVENLLFCEYQTPNAKTKRVMLKLYDNAGRLLTTQKMDKHDRGFGAQIDVSRLTSGAFWVVAEEDNAQRTVKSLRKP
jgi:Subtilase family/GEVED domain/Secretion system C-terminal sorting domain